MLTLSNIYQSFPGAVAASSVVLTPAITLDMLIVPAVAEDTVSSEEHGDSSCSTPLHIDVFVVITAPDFLHSSKQPPGRNITGGEPHGQLPQPYIHQVPF